MKEFTLPALTAGIQNQGLNNYVPKNNATILKQVISISANGANTGATFYQKHPFTVLQDAYAIKLKKNELSKLNDNQYLFFVSAISKSISNMFEWTNKATWERVKERKISLPTKKGNIDYDFMDSFVAELEAQRVAELEAYLKTTGLNDYELTDEEKKVLSLSEKTASNEVRHSADNAKNETIKFKDFKITDIFEIKNTKSIIRSKIIPGSGTTPYLTASEQNNSISTYIHCSENMIDKGHCLFIGGKTLVITYQKKDFCSNDSHNLALYYKGNYFLSDKEQLYFCGALNKALLHKYSWDNSISKTKIKNNIIRLPINKQNKIDFDYMEKYITAIEKLIIKNVVEYKDKLVDQTKKLVD